MEIRVLRYFLEIARQGSMTAAGETLHVSQSALSRQMKELEDEPEALPPGQPEPVSDRGGDSPAEPCGGHCGHGGQNRRRIRCHG